MRARRAHHTLTACFRRSVFGQCGAGVLGRAKLRAKPARPQGAVEGVCHRERPSSPPTCHLERVSLRTSRKVPRSAVSRLSLQMACVPGGISIAPSLKDPPKPKPPSFLPGIFRLRGLGGRSAQDDRLGAVSAAMALLNCHSCDDFVRGYLRAIASSRLRRPRWLKSNAIDPCHPCNPCPRTAMSAMTQTKCDGSVRIRVHPRPKLR